ncbi:unnamed protein product [Trichobilharzia regenti]|nr:unnamed protein product [Trichobilharzia regenti]
MNQTQNPSIPTPKSCSTNHFGYRKTKSEFLKETYNNGCPPCKSSLMNNTGVFGMMGAGLKPLEKQRHHSLGMQLHPDDELQKGRNMRPAFHW